MSDLTGDGPGPDRVTGIFSQTRTIYSISIQTGKDLGPDPVETGAGTAAGRGGDLVTGDSLAQDQETGRETGDPRTERRKRTVILR